MNTLPNKWYEYFLFRKGMPLLLMVTVCLIISSWLGYKVPLLVADLGRNYSVEADFYRTIQHLIFLFLGIYLNRVVYQWSAMTYVTRLIRRVRALCYNSWLNNYDIQTEEKTTSERYPMGEVLARIMNDTEAFRELITSGTLSIFIDIFFVFSCLVSFIGLNKYSGTFLVSVEVGAAILLIWGSKYMRTVFLSVRNAQGNVSKTVANVVGGIKETYYTNHGNYASKKCEIVFEDFLKKILSSNIWDSVYYSLAESLYPLLLAMVIFIFPYSAITEAAIILAIVDLIQRSIDPIKSIAGKITNIQRAITGYVRVSDFLQDLEHKHRPGVSDKWQPIDFKKMKVKVEYFSYPRKEGEERKETFALENNEFEGEKGQLIGMAGLSGSGKSTLLNILAANILPKQAKIVLTEQNGNELEFPGNSIEDVIRYREQVGIVSQDSHIFSESVKFNITLDRKEHAGFSDFWAWLTERIPYLFHWGIAPETILDQKSLSLGQKQLLAGIRACYLKKTIVLFDEISSGLDSELEEALRKVVLLIQEHSLTIIVAHRLETIVNADKILVMDHGRLVSSGIHSELLQKSEVYQQFVAELSH